MSERSLKHVVADYKVALDAVALPAGSYERLRARKTSGRWRGVAFGASLATLTASFVFVWVRMSADDGYRWQEQSLDFSYVREAGGLIVTSGSAVLDSGEFATRIALGTATQLRQETDGFRLVRGEALVDVSPSARVPTFYVSDGVIRIRGTRFALYQGQADGNVQLYEGRIEFEGGNGRTLTLNPGEALRWPLEDAVDEGTSLSPTLAPPPVQVAEEDAKPSPPPPPPPPGPQQRVKRRQRRSAPTEVVNAVTPAPEAPPAAAPEPVRSAQEEAQGALWRVFGEIPGDPGEIDAEDLRYLENEAFDRGQLLTLMAMRREGCRHWKLVAQAFPSSRRIHEVRQAQSLLGCVAE